MDYQPLFDFQFNNVPLIRNKEKKNISSVGKACGGAVVAFIAIETILSLILFGSKKFVKLYETNDLFNAGFMIILTVIALFIPFYMAYSSLKDKKILNELPFGAPNDKKDAVLLIPIALMVCMIGNIFSVFLSIVVNSLFGIEFTSPEDTSDYQSALGIIVSVIATAVLPALLEEFAIRGVVLQSLRKYGDKYAIIMSSVVFALMHGNMIQIPFAFIAGIGFAYVAIKTNSIWPGIIVHFLNNCLAVAASVAVENLSDNGSTIYMLCFYAVIFVIGIICSIAYQKKNPLIFSCLSSGKMTYLKTSEKVNSFIFNFPMVIAISILIGQTAMYIK